MRDAMVKIFSKGTVIRRFVLDVSLADQTNFKEGLAGFVPNLVGILKYRNARFQETFGIVMQM